MDILTAGRSWLQGKLTPEQRKRLKQSLFPKDDANQYRHDGPRPQSKLPASELEEIYWAHRGRTSHKWHHYFWIYERYLGPRRGTDVKVLEIGVSAGGSLDILRKYLGPDATLFGVDIDTNCAAFDGESGSVRLGSQDDPNFLMSVIEEMGGIDIVIDDGSHVSSHMRASLEVLFPKLASNGVYIMEDVHCSYWGSYLGGYRKGRSIVEFSKKIIDDMHHWYHGKGAEIDVLKDGVLGVHFYDSVIVIEKGQVEPPRGGIFGRDT